MVNVGGKVDKYQIYNGTHIRLNTFVKKCKKGALKVQESRRSTTNNGGSGGGSGDAPIVSCDTNLQCT